MKKIIRVNPQTYTLPESLTPKVKATLEDWRVGNKVARLWSGDATLWTGTDEGKWLGWLRIIEDQLAHTDHLNSLSEEIKRARFSHALLLGMGGSSLCPEMMSKTFGKLEQYPELLVLDSTDPAQIKRYERRVALEKTLFIVSSKSGTTFETNILKEYFFDRVKQTVGADRAGKSFIAITDPGSNLQQIAEADGFRKIFFGLPGIGGRYSALSDFGMVPAAIMGVDVLKFLVRVEEMVEACKPGIPIEENPGVLLGVLLGVLGKNGRDKVTLITSPGIGNLGAWLEQLLAESTGKDGKGLIPIESETLGQPEIYGNDRLFVYINLEGASDTSLDRTVDLLERSGQPVVRISLKDSYDLSQEFFRWEIATAVAGSIIGINPFNQPDVEASKIATKRLMEIYEATGSLPQKKPALEDIGIKLFMDEKEFSSLSNAAGNDLSLIAFLRENLKRLQPGDYFAILAYLDMNDSNQKELQYLRLAVRDVKRVATCLGFGPRFLHSTGQLYKGGPNTGLFLQITCDNAEDLPVPGRKFTFGIVKAAQAGGDFKVLTERGRRAIWIHLGVDVKAGLLSLRNSIQQALL